MCGSSSALSDVDKGFPLVVGGAEPLHVPRLVGPTSTQGDCVVYLPAWAGPMALACGGAGLHLLEAVHLSG